MSLNKVILQGRLVADPELKHTTVSNTAVCSYRIAVDRDFKDKDSGERKADFINVTAWSGTAEFVSKYFRKGQLMVLDGRLQVRDYEDNEGKRRYMTEVVADKVWFCGSKNENGGGSSGSGEPAFRPAANAAPATVTLEDIGISGEDELPF